MCRVAALVLVVAVTADAQSVPFTTPVGLMSRQAIVAAPSDLTAGTTRSVATLEGSGGPTLLATIDRHPENGDVLTLWASTGSLFRPVRHLSGPDDPRIGYITVPRRFSWRGQAFVHLSVQLSGTGDLHDDEVLHLGTTGDLTAVDFVQAPEALASKLAPGEGVWKGARYDFADDELTFEFFVWKQGDGNCCPTGGRVTGTYALKNGVQRDGRRGWVMGVGSFTRHPPER
jgi:hypothetical protein